MATAEKINLKDPVKDAEQARTLAARYRCEFVDLREAHIDHDLFHSVPVDLMFRYNFVPMHASEGTLEIALADPRNLRVVIVADVRRLPAGFRHRLPPGSVVQADALVAPDD